MTRKFKITISIIILFIVIPVVYLAYDRSLMPPMPEYKSPPFVPGETWDQYATRFLETGKKPNALEHYLVAYSLFSEKSYLDSDGKDDINTIMRHGWTKPYPDANKLLEANKAVLNEIIAGVQLDRCEFPPVAFGEKAPYPEFKYTFANAIFQKLLNVSGKKLEYEKKYRQTLDYYLYSLQFITDIQEGKQSESNILLNLPFMQDNTKAILQLILNNKLNEIDYRYLITELAKIDQKQVNVGEQIHSDFRHIPWKERNKKMDNSILYAQEFNSAGRIGYLGGKSMAKGLKLKGDFEKAYQDLVANPKFIINDLYLAGYVFFNKGRIKRNFYDFTVEIDKLYTTKTYKELTKVDWKKITPKDKINYVYSTMVSNTLTAYREQMIEKTKLRQAQIQAAVQLYHLEKKRWPKGLDDLKLYLAPTPVDPFSDKPFLWSQDSVGHPFAYSVGPDFIDNTAKLVYDPTNGSTSSGDIKSN